MNKITAITVLLVSLMIFSTAQATKAQSKSKSNNHSSVGGGFILEASQGASYKNPAFGGFFRVHFANGRFDLRNVLDIEHDEKTFSSSGSTIRDRVLVGALIGKYFKPVFGLEVASHTNPEYNKTGVAFGGGMIFVFKSQDGWTLAEPYVIYFLPDSSPNKVQKIVGGLEVSRRFKDKLWLFIAGEGFRNTFDQPFTSPVIHGLTASGFRFRVGFIFSFGGNP